MVLKTEPKSKFLLVKCQGCKNEQTVFNKPAKDIKCLVCGELLVKSTGGYGDVKGKVLKELE